MRTIGRLLAVVILSYGVLVLTMSMLLRLLPSSSSSFTEALLFVAPILSVITAGVVWVKTAPGPSLSLSDVVSLMLTIGVGALAGGVIGFVIGFFGPGLLERPGNLAPLAGLFLTGPLGIFVGGFVGYVRWKRNVRV